MGRDCAPRRRDLQRRMKEERRLCPPVCLPGSDQGCLCGCFQQVNMVIGILVFNKLVSRDGILDKKLKHRAG